MQKFNVNDYVKVKLTDCGKDIFYHRFDEVNSFYGREVIKPHYPDVDKDGYTKFQLWNLMEIYGRYIGMTKTLPFETNILIYQEWR